jgi:hypothetical protein
VSHDVGADRDRAGGVPTRTEVDLRANLTRAIHLHYCDDKPFGYCGLTPAHEALANRLVDFMAGATGGDR